MYLYSAGYLVNGEETKKYLLSIGVKEEKIHIGGMSADSTGLRNSISKMSAYEKQSIKSRFKNGEGGIIYLYCGRIEEAKGAPHLLEAWESHIKNYPNDSIVLVGYGDMSELLKTKYQMEHSIFLEGRIDYSQIYKYYASADVFILPTLQDNWSLVIPEAMSCGLPVATSIYNGCYSELIHEGENGCSFDTFDKTSILRALDYFHHVDLKAHGEKSIEIEKEFNTENSARREYEGIMTVLGK